MSAAPFTDAEMAECAAREVRQRQVVYRRLVNRGTMTRAVADREIALMRAISEHFTLRATARPQDSGRLL